MAKKAQLDPASRSQGTRTNPAGHWVRFTEAQNTRIHEILRLEGKTIQTFIHDATIAALDEVDRQHDERESRRNEKKQAATTVTAPKGYGLRRREADENPYDIATMRVPEPEPEPTSAPQIVINTSPPPSPGAEVNRLAAFVTKGDAPGRTARLETAAKILAISAKDDAEKQSLARALDAQIALLDAEAGQKPASSPLSFITDFFKL